jgi:hypothetical protein
MKEVIVNRIKIKCSKGRIEKGEKVILSDAEIQKITCLRPDSVTVLREIVEPAKVEKTKRKSRNAKSRSFN